MDVIIISSIGKHNFCNDFYFIYCFFYSAGIGDNKKS